MSYQGVYTPTYASPADGELITLCKILDVLSGAGGVADNVNISGPLDPNGNVKVSFSQASVQIVDQNGDNVDDGNQNLRAACGSYNYSGGSITTSSPTVTYGDGGNGANLTQYSTFAFQTTITGTITGTVTIQGTINGTTWTNTTYVALTSGNSSSSFNAATATIGQINVSGLLAIRFVLSGGSGTGTVNIAAFATSATSNVMLDNPLPSGTNAIGSLYNPGTFASGQQAVTATAAALPSSALVNGVVITNGSTATVYIGGSGVTSSTGYALAVGATVGIGVAQLSAIYIVGTASSGNVSYIGS
jgi:hypothetical protein